MNITACVVVENKGRTLTRWFKCMRQIANEIVIINIGSIDNIREIAMEVNAKVYSLKNKDDLAAAKNCALDKATGDWVIFLDDNEYFTDESLDILKRDMLVADDKIDGFVCRKKKYVKCEAIDNFYKLCVFRNNRNLCYKGCSYTQLVNGLQKKINITVLDDLVIYYTKCSSRVMAEKIRYSLKLLRQNNGETATLIHLVECYIDIKHYDKAIKCCEKFIISSNNDNNLRIYIYSKWLEMVIDIKSNYVAAQKVLKNAIKEFPNNGEVLYFKAKLLYLQKKYTEAEQCFKEILVLKTDNENLNASMLAGRYADIYADLGRLYELKGQNNRAIKNYVKSLQINCFNNDILVYLYRQINKLDDIYKIELLNSIYDGQNKIGFLLNMLYNTLSEKISLYYKKMLQEKYNVKFPCSIANDFFITGNIKGTINMLGFGLEDTYKFLAADAIMNKRGKTQLQNKIPAVYNNIVKDYDLLKDIKIDTDNKKKYSDISVIVKMSDRDKNNGK
ncbi:tetratricopeptide repeat protein [Pectinatus brassicae]|uniref:Tetratricopeptide (TPR) repeat protein n=1 Tax=Pectinatus brassicae TaxID=862415 RepID=A0A840UQ57_9FIRM|nr:tetratricopeptide repeat protein [Pectinatus brassicae]MBB5336838.1 tetratricopeptide (TPR) repeat protein [Pectinatus brassicae]